MQGPVLTNNQQGKAGVGEDDGEQPADDRQAPEAAQASL